MRIQYSTNITITGNNFNLANKNALNAFWCRNLRILGNQFVNYNQSNSYNPGMLLVGTIKSKVVENDFSVANESYGVVCDSTSDQVVIARNQVLYSATFNPVFLNLCADANVMQFSVPAGADKVNVPNTLIYPGCRFTVTQLSGAPLAFTKTINYLSFDLTLGSPAVGDEVFEYEIEE